MLVRKVPSFARHAGRAKQQFSFELSQMTVESGLPASPSGFLTVSTIVVQCGRGPKLYTSKEVETPKSAASGVSLSHQKLSFRATLFESKKGKASGYSEKKYKIAVLAVKPDFGTTKTVFKEVAALEINVADYSLDTEPRRMTLSLASTRRGGAPVVLDLCICARKVDGGAGDESDEEEEGPKAAARLEGERVATSEVPSPARAPHSRQDPDSGAAVRAAGAPKLAPKLASSTLGFDGEAELSEFGEEIPMPSDPPPRIHFQKTHRAPEAMAPAPDALSPADEVLRGGKTPARDDADDTTESSSAVPKAARGAFDSPNMALETDATGSRRSSDSPYVPIDGLRAEMARTKAELARTKVELEEALAAKAESSAERGELDGAMAKLEEQNEALRAAVEKAESDREKALAATRLIMREKDKAEAERAEALAALAKLEVSCAEAAATQDDVLWTEVDRVKREKE